MSKKKKLYTQGCQTSIDMSDKNDEFILKLATGVCFKSKLTVDDIVIKFPNNDSHKIDIKNFTDADGANHPKIKNYSTVLNDFIKLKSKDENFYLYWTKKNKESKEIIDLYLKKERI